MSTNSTGTDGSNLAPSSVGLRVGAIFILLICSFFGSVVPRVIQACCVSTPATMKIVTRLGNALGAGIILGTALMHCAVDAHALNDVVLQATGADYPFDLMVVTCTIILFYIMETELSHCTLRYSVAMDEAPSSPPGRDWAESG